MKIISAFDDVVHQNSRTNLGGSITDNQHWKICWAYLNNPPSQSYYPLMSMVGQIFLNGLTTHMKNIVDCL